MFSSVGLQSNYNPIRIKNKPNLEKIFTFSKCSPENNLGVIDKGLLSWTEDIQIQWLV